MVLIKNAEIVADPWRHLGDEDPFPNDGPVTISWKRWLLERDGIDRDKTELGVRVPNDVAPADLGRDAQRFALIALTFPTFGDGRALSQARLLRSRFGFRDELRATGAVLRDLLLFMQRCGIDAFEVSDRAVTENWFAAFGEFDVFYQPAEDNRPWIARQRLLSS